MGLRNAKELLKNSKKVYIMLRNSMEL